MIYELTGMTGKTEVVGELREFVFEDGDLTICGITLQDARNILTILATGHIGTPLTYGGVLQELVNHGAPGPITNSTLLKGEEPAYMAQVSQAPARLSRDMVPMVAYSADAELKKFSDKVEGMTPESKAVQKVLDKVAATKPTHKALAKEVTEPELAAAETEHPAPAAEPVAETKSKQPSARRSMPPPETAQAVAIQSIADEVAKEVAGTPVMPIAKEPAAEAVTERKWLLDPNNLPTWLTGAKTMRVLLVGFGEHELKDTESIYAECMRVKDKVPFFAAANFRERIKGGLVILYGTDVG